jgi:hypothetical protein
MRSSAIRILRPGVTLVAAILVGAIMIVPASASAAGPTLLKAPTLSSKRPHIGVQLTTTPGEWTGNPTITYQWFRGGNMILGATGSTYTPTAEDIGPWIQVQITAKNSEGTSGTSLQTEPLTGRFAVCNKVTAGTGLYSEAHCTQAGGLANYAWSWLESSNLPVSYKSGIGTGFPYTIKFTAGGIIVSVKCSGSSGAGSISGNNPEGPEMSAQLTLSGCYVDQPAGQGCYVGNSSQVFMSEIAGKPLEYAKFPRMEFKVQTSSAKLADLTIEGCTEPLHRAIAHTYPIYGNPIGKFFSGKQELGFEQSALKVAGANGTLAEGASLIEGVNGEGIKIEP